MSSYEFGEFPKWNDKLNDDAILFEVAYSSRFHGLLERIPADIPLDRSGLLADQYADLMFIRLEEVFGIPAEQATLRLYKAKTQENFDATIGVQSYHTEVDIAFDRMKQLEIQEKIQRAEKNIYKHRRELLTQFMLASYEGTSDSAPTDTVESNTHAFILTFESMEYIRDACINNPNANQGAEYLAETLAQYKIFNLNPIWAEILREELHEYVSGDVFIAALKELRAEPVTVISRIANQLNAMHDLPLDLRPDMQLILKKLQTDIDQILRESGHELGAVDAMDLYENLLRHRIAHELSMQLKFSHNHQVPAVLLDRQKVKIAERMQHILKQMKLQNSKTSRKIISHISELAEA